MLKGMGRAINKTVTIAEIIKRRIPNLHQLTEIGSVNITDTWEPLEEGLNTLETTRVLLGAHEHLLEAKSGDGTFSIPTSLGVSGIHLQAQGLDILAIASLLASSLCWSLSHTTHSRELPHHSGSMLSSCKLHDADEGSHDV